MRPSIRRCLTGLLMAAALAFDAASADARGGGGCGPCYFIGITPAPGGSPQDGGFQAGGFNAKIGHESSRDRQKRHGDNRYDGGYYRGY